MTTAGTYGAMQARIANEVLGTAAASDIQNAIQDAIRVYERQRFWFNEARWGMDPRTDGQGNPIVDGGGNFVTSSPLFTTIPGIEFYDSGTSSLINSVAHLDKLILVQAQNRYTLTPQTPQWMDDAAVGLLWRAIPTDWTYVAESIRLYPIPDAAYPILAYGTQRWGALILTTDTNPWMVEAERLIRSEAKRIIHTDLYRNDIEAARCAKEAAMQLQALMGETAQRGPPTRLRATRF